MANPIIKIKRGSGVPTPAGITAGEFAFNKTGNILYIGACGGYTGYDGNLSLGEHTTTNNDLNIIPIGMQISNDPEMGAGADLNVRAGYSNFTVPTTYAVRNWVNQTKMNQVLGATFRAGPGIGITSDQDAGSTQYDVTISNTGVIKGFTGFNVIGNSHPLSDVVKAKSAIDGITFIGGGGIRLRGTNTDGTLEIQNIGVTSIGGFTGTINTITPIVTLDGFTAGIGLAVRQVVAIGSGSPLGIASANIIGTEGISRTGIEISHSNSLSIPVTHTGILSGVPQLLDLSVNLFGHVTGYSSVPLNFANVLPLGFTEAVQDAAYPGLTGIVPYGIQYVYDDAATPGVLRTINRGITSIYTSGQPGLSGPVLFVGDTNISVAADSSKTPNQMTFGYAGKQYANFAAKLPPSVSYTSGSGIYIGGVTGPGAGTLAAATSNSTLTAIAGRGIGICMGVQNSTDTMLIWNAGVNRISAYNTGSVLLGGTGFSGNMDLVAGTNIVFSRGSGASDNTLTISSTGGGGGGAVSWLQGDYTTETAEDYSAIYQGDGITGAVSVSGLNGIITKQDTGSAGSPSTKNGSLVIGLGSRVYIPPNIVTGIVYPSVGSFNSELVIATARETAAPELPNASYASLLKDYSRLVTDVVEGGLTAAFTYGIPPAGSIINAFSPTLPATFSYATSEPGKILSLRAKEGIYDLSPPAGIPSASGKYAELRLLGYPNPENMSAYIQEVYDHATANDNSTGCPGGNCIGYPSILPSCNIELIEGIPSWYYTDGFGTRVLPQGTQPNVNGSDWSGQLVGTSVFHSNVVARDSLFVTKDIWLTGELIDATTGCLYAAGAGGGTSVFNGGNLGLTGDLVVGGSIYVHGGTAFFNVADLSVESPLIRLGGVSASTGYSDAMLSTSSGNAYANSDRGLLLYSYHATPYGALHNQSAIGARVVTNFIGIDSSDGTFKYLIASSVPTNGTTTTINGRLGPANFSEINSVGITSNGSGLISLKAGTGSGVITDAQLYGHVSLNGGISTARGTINVGNVASVSFGTSQEGSIINFTRGITFLSQTDATQFDGEANALRISYNGTDNIGRTISIRNPGSTKHSQIVDTGRGYPNLANINTPTELNQQTIYNKTLADGTIIDCGTY
jgi:hypothetical protein